MTALESDLAPIYGPKGEIATGMRRETLLELRTFFENKLGQMLLVHASCRDCTHKNGLICKKFNATMPPDYTGDDCPEWQFDGIEF